MTLETERRRRELSLHARSLPAVLAGLCLALVGCSSDGRSGACDPDAGPCGTGGATGTGGTTGTGAVTGGGTVQPGDPCNGTVDCTPGSICWNEICVGEGSLRFSLAWTVASDFDLHVQTPSGTEIYYGNRDAEGASLDVDDCIGSSCRNPTGTHVENIFWVGEAPSGTYEVWVVNYNGAESGTFTIEAAGTGSGPFTGTLDASSGASSEHYSVTF